MNTLLMEASKILSPAQAVRSQHLEVKGRINSHKIYIWLIEIFTIMSGRQSRLLVPIWQLDFWQTFSSLVKMNWSKHSTYVTYRCICVMSSGKRC